jgi:hypothetical protein
VSVANDYDDQHQTIEDQMKTNDQEMKFSSLEEFMDHRIKRNNQIRNEWNEIFSMTYDSLIEVLEEMNNQMKEEKEKQNGISTKTF